MKIIAITGSIGCGKTTLAGVARELGYAVFDVDGFVRRLYFKKYFLEVIKTRFPEVFEENVFNKRKLRNTVFSDYKKLKILEDIIHPFLKRELKRVISKSYKNTEFLFIDIALLFEMGWDKFCDLIILAYVDKDVQKKRVMKRDNISAEDFEKIAKKQMCSDKKRKISDVIIDTDQTIGSLKQEMINIMNGMIYG